MASFALVIPTKKTPEQAIAAIKEAYAARKFSVLFELAFLDRIAAAGLPQLSSGAKAHLIEFCHAPTARLALEANFDMAYFMPCKTLVRWHPSGETEICLLRPSAIATFLPGAADDALLKGMTDIEEKIVEALKEAAGTA